MNRLALALSRAWFLTDTGMGRVAGSACPSCGTRPTADSRVRSARFGSVVVYRCGTCGLLFRPTGLTADRFAGFYYSWIYGNANLATDVEAIGDLQQLRDKMGSRRRADLLRQVAPMPAIAPMVYVLGCSWGYEVWDLQQSGFRAVGIEVSDPRRELGRSRLGLPLYATVRDAVANEPPPDIVLSSHVLEHIPRLEPYLNDLLAAVSPTCHVHITPNVEQYPDDPASHRLIGREHPIGVTRAFWQHFAAARGFELASRIDRYRPGEWSGELVAILR